MKLRSCFSIIWLTLAGWLLYAILDNCLSNYLPHMSFEIFIAGLGIWWALRNEDLKRGWITYNLYEENGIRCIRVLNTGRSIAKDIRIHMATEPRTCMIYHGWCSDFEAGNATCSPRVSCKDYAIAHVSNLSPGDEFIYQLAPCNLAFTETTSQARSIKRYWLVGIDPIKQLKVSFEFGSNQGNWFDRLFSRVKYDKHLR